MVVFSYIYSLHLSISASFDSIQREVKKMNGTGTQVVLGLFDDHDSADKAVDELKDFGYDAGDISVITKEWKTEQRSKKGAGRDMAEGAGKGAMTGGAIGGVAGLLAGVGAIALPGGIGLLAAGPVASAIAGALGGAAAGAAAGGLIGALMGVGLSEKEAKLYAERVESGDVLVAVPIESDDEGPATQILEDNGAMEINTVTMDSSSFGSFPREEESALS
jgi:hypothetical protein